MQATNISNDIWVTILSYLKDATPYPVNPDQFIAIMKMSFVNKTLINLISSNTFWILYNSNEYAPAKYNIYNCNLNFCQIMHKIIALKTIENIQKVSKSIFTSDTCNRFYIVNHYNASYTHKYNLSNKEIVNSHAILNNKCESYLKCHTLVESVYCILFTGRSGTNYDGWRTNYDGWRTRFCIKKNNQFSCNDKFTTLSDFYDNAIDLNTYDLNATLHDNYIWLTTYTIETHNINFYAINVMTSVKYLISRVENPYHSSYYPSCYFTK